MQQQEIYNGEEYFLQPSSDVILINDGVQTQGNTNVLTVADGVIVGKKK